VSDVSVDDDALAMRWRALGDLPSDTIGHRVWISPFQLGASRRCGRGFTRTRPG
jgi:hypothetical protein